MDDDTPVTLANVQSTWSKQSGPGTVTFANANAVDTTAKFSAPGIYVLTLTASDTALTTSDTVVVTVSASDAGVGGSGGQGGAGGSGGQSGLGGSSGQGGAGGLANQGATGGSGGQGEMGGFAGQSGANTGGTTPAPMGSVPATRAGGSNADSGAASSGGCGCRIGSRGTSTTASFELLALGLCLAPRRGLRRTGAHGASTPRSGSRSTRWR